MVRKRIIKVCGDCNHQGDCRTDDEMPACPNYEDVINEGKEDEEMSDLW